MATMASDPDGVYGERIYELGLSEAVERGVLAPFEIDVLEIEDPDFSVGLSEEALRGRRLALLQAALLEHAAVLNLRTVLTFHQQVEEAKAFAANLPDTASDLHDTQVSERALAEADARPASAIRAEPAGLEGLEAGRHVPADRVWSDWLCGDHPIAHRREVLRQFANGIDAAGHRVHRAFLASVKVLGEGVDIVGERGVEAVCIVGARGSMVQIVQNIGRGLRPNPDGTAKTCRIIVPVFLTPGEDPTNIVASASFQPLVDILQGLRSHDERLVEQLASRSLTRQPREKKHHVTADKAGSEDETTEPEPVSVMMNFASPRDPATIAAFVRTRVIRPDATVWLEGWQALQNWRAHHGITGRHAVPYDTTVTMNGQSFNLGRGSASSAATTGRASSTSTAASSWTRPAWCGSRATKHGRRAVRVHSFHRAHGHLAPRQDAVWIDIESGESELAPIGQHMANLRRKGGLGKDTDRAERRAAQLTAIDPDWDCPWPLDWQRHYRVLADLVDADGVLPAIKPGVLFDGDDLGKWINRQTRNWHLLSEVQQQRLAGLGIEPAPKPLPAPTAKAATKRSLSAAFQRGVTALAQYIAREGTTTVRRPHRETILVDGQEHELALGIWYANQKQRRDKLTETQRVALSELGVEWA